MLKELGKYDTIIVVFSSFMVAGSFLFSSVEIITFKYIGILLFFGGVLGIMYSFFGGFSKYCLNFLKLSMKKDAEKGIQFYVGLIFYIISKYLKNLFVSGTFVIFGLSFTSLSLLTYEFITQPAQFFEIVTQKLILSKGNKKDGDEYPL